MINSPFSDHHVFHVSQELKLVMHHNHLVVYLDMFQLVEYVLLALVAQQLVYQIVLLLPQLHLSLLELLVLLVQLVQVHVQVVPLLLNVNLDIT